MHGGHCTHHHCPPTVIIAAAAATKENSQQTCNPWCLGCRHLRYVLAFLGMLACILDFLLRYNLSVAIVAMVNSTASSSSSSAEDFSCPAAHNATHDAQATLGAGEYNWSKQQQGIVLSTFFWGYLVTKVIGGRIAEVVGARATVGVALGLCGVLALLSPTAADLHPIALAALRLLMGLLQGPIFPATYSIIARWVAPGQVAFMMGLMYSGVGLGALLSLGLSGVIIKSLGWRWVFWGSGLLTLAWVPVWMICVRNSPKQHPRISAQELHLLAANQNETRRRVPWSRLLRTKIIYVLIMMEFVTVWYQGILLTEAPVFLISYIGIDLETSGIVSTVMTVVAWAAILFYSWLSDMLERRQWLRPVTIRRLIQAFGSLLTVGASVGLMAAGCNAVVVSVMVTIIAFGAPVTIATYLLTPMDIAPNYAGTVSGLVGLGGLAGPLLPPLVSFLQTIENGWNILFLSSIGIYTTVTFTYIVLVTTTEEEWNKYKEIQDDTTPDGRVGRVK